MNFLQPAIDVIGSLVSSLSFPVDVLTATNLGGGKHSLEVCNMWHAQPGFEVTIGGKKYLIEDIKASVSDECGARTVDKIKIKGATSSITAKAFEMYKPFFFYGTPMAEGTELSEVKSSKDKTPMYWLRLDDFSNHGYTNDGLERRERDIKFRIYPLSFSDHEKWQTADAKKLVVDPMYRLAEVFIKAIESRPERFDTDNFTWDIPAVFPKFGVISINRGVEKSLWHDKLGGVELSIDLTVFRKSGC